MYNHARDFAGLLLHNVLLGETFEVSLTQIVAALKLIHLPSSRRMKTLPDVLEDMRTVCAYSQKVTLTALLHLMAGRFFVIEAINAVYYFRYWLDCITPNVLC